MARKILVGMLLLGALIIFALSTFYIENWQFLLKEGYTLTARFETAQNLDQGDLVRLAGVTVGKVIEISVSPEETRMPVEMVMWLERDAIVRADDSADIVITSVFGGNYVSIIRGDPTARILPAGSEVIKTRVAPSVPDLVEESRTTLLSIQAAFDEFSSLTSELRDGAVGRLLTDPEAYDDVKNALSEVRDAFAELRTFITEVREGKGLLAKFISDEETAADFDTMVADASDLASNLRQITADIQEGKGTFGKLFTDEILYEDLKSTVSDLGDLAAEAKEGKGAFTKMLYDEKLAADLDQIVVNVKDATGRLTETLDELMESSRAISEGEGTLPKLISDDKLYKQITGLVESVQNMVNDYREQSPLITFAGAVFGAF